MNLHGIAAGAIGAVNPFIPVTVRQSMGASEDETGRSVPTYAAPLSVTGQKQALSGRDIQRINALSVQGVVCKMYMNGNYEGLFRVTGKGGDLLTFDGQTYLVATVLERWPDWCCLALAMQLDGDIST